MLNIKESHEGNFGCRALYCPDCKLSRTQSILHMRIYFSGFICKCTSAHVKRNGRNPLVLDKQNFF